MLWQFSKEIRQADATQPLKNGHFSHKLKLDAAATFTILKTVSPPSRKITR